MVEPLLLVVELGTWAERAACRTCDPSINFLPVRGDDSRLAKLTCAGCEVRAQCLDYALTCPPVAGLPIQGIWGGTSDKQRRRMRRGEEVIPQPLTQPKPKPAPKRGGIGGIGAARRLADRRYRATHVEYDRDRKRRWAADHRDNLKAADARYDATHPGARQARTKAYNEAHREARRAYSRAYQAARRAAERAERESSSWQAVTG